MEFSYARISSRLFFCCNIYKITVDVNRCLCCWCPLLMFRCCLKDYRSYNYTTWLACNKSSMWAGLFCCLKLLSNFKNLWLCYCFLSHSQAPVVLFHFCFLLYCGYYTLCPSKIGVCLLPPLCAAVEVGNLEWMMSLFQWKKLHLEYVDCYFT